MAVLQKQIITVAKGDVDVPTALVEDLFAPNLALRTGHHILYLIQFSAAQRRRTVRKTRRRVSPSTRHIWGEIS